MVLIAHSWSGGMQENRKITRAVLNHTVDYPHSIVFIMAAIFDEKLVHCISSGQGTCKNLTTQDEGCMDQSSSKLFWPCRSTLPYRSGTQCRPFTMPPQLHHIQPMSPSTRRSPHSDHPNDSFTTLQKVSKRQNYHHRSRAHLRCSARQYEVSPLQSI